MERMIAIVVLLVVAVVVIWKFRQPITDKVLQTVAKVGDKTNTTEK